MSDPERLIAPALILGSDWNECHEAGYLLSHYHLRQSTPTCNKMGWRDFLHVPKKRRRAQNGARNEVGSLRGAGESDLVAPRPTESAPDLRSGSPNPPTSSPLASHNQESIGM